MKLSREEVMAAIGQTVSMLLQKSGEGTGHCAIVYETRERAGGVSTITTLPHERMVEMLQVIIDQPPETVHDCKLNAEDLMAKVASRD